jgi:hypothetical protein
LDISQALLCGEGGTSAWLIAYGLA